jgi:preprotein translocase subunit SecA
MTSSYFRTFLRVSKLRAARPMRWPARGDGVHVVTMNDYLAQYGAGWLASIARPTFGSANDRALKGYQQRVPAIHAPEQGMKALSAMAAKTVEFRARVADGEMLDDLLPEASARCGGEPADVRAAALRPAACGRDGAARRQDLRNEDR